MKPYYEEDGITIYHGDATEVAADMSLVVTDPPYGRDVALCTKSRRIVGDDGTFLRN
jgi:hypothetical protein